MFVATGLMYGEHNFERALYWARKARDEAHGYNAARTFADDCWQEAERRRRLGFFGLHTMDFARIGAEFGNPYCVAEIGMCYWIGLDVDKDIHKTKALLETAKRIDGYDPSFYKEYEDTYQLAQKAVDHEYEALRRKQLMAEDDYKRSYASSSSSSLGPVIVLGAIIAGLAAICDAIDTPSKPSSTSSYSSSSRSSSSASYSSSHSHSSSSSSSSSYSICPDCSGRGMMICVWCHGTGICDGGWFSADSECSFCKGKGQVYCWHCSGRGSRKN